MENIREKYFSSIWEEMTTLTKIPQPHVHSLVLPWHVQSHLQSAARVFLEGKKAEVGTPILKEGFPGRDLHQYRLFFSIDILPIPFIVYLPKLLIPQILTDICLIIFIHSLFNTFGLRFCSVTGILLGTG